MLQNNKVPSNSTGLWGDLATAGIAGHPREKLRVGRQNQAGKNKGWKAKRMQTIQPGKEWVEMDMYLPGWSGIWEPGKWVGLEGQVRGKGEKELLQGRREWLDLEWHEG